MLGSFTASALPLGGVQAPAATYRSSLPNLSPVPSSCYPPGLSPALIARHCILFTSSFFVFLILFSYFHHLFSRYERYVQDGGDANFDQYLFTLVPDLLAFLQDHNDSVPLRKRRAGSS